MVCRGQSRAEKEREETYAQILGTQSLHQRTGTFSACIFTEPRPSGFLLLLLLVVPQGLWDLSSPTRG